MERTDIPGFGVDRRREDRPGVPMERDPQPVAGAHWDTPPAQQPRVEIQKRAGLEQLTAVFGTAQPPHGLSGIIRRAAYRVPEHRSRHWLMLLLADRVDVVESGISDLLRRRPLTVVGLGAAAALLTFAVARPR